MPWWSTRCCTPGPGIEALSGIPGATGATPVQNVGAYGSDVSQTIAAVRTWDRERNAVRTFTNSELKFGYRDSILKQTTVKGSPRYVVLTVEFQLPLGRMSAPIRYAELARSLGVEPGKQGLLQRCPPGGAAAQGLQGHGPGTRRTGTPIPPVPSSPTPSSRQTRRQALPEGAPRYPAGADGLVKLSAAWLIDHAGFGKGFGAGGRTASPAAARRCPPSTPWPSPTGAAASAADMVAVAREVRRGVVERFGIELHPEPLLIGVEL